MFSYYGSKSKIIDHYPPPKFGKIIEPFAGSARYSLKFWQNDILLIDKYDVIIKIWLFLQNASSKDILGLPALKNKEDIRDYNLSEDELNFCRFHIGAGLAAPQWLSSSMCTYDMQKKSLKRISENLFKIKHWNIKLDNYLDLKDEECTWFIDPPYQFGGHKYKESNKNIDFNELSNWCKNRSGHVIVCENTKATWMDFKPMVQMQGAMFKTTEAIWSNIPTSFDNIQTKLF